VLKLGVVHEEDIYSTLSVSSEPS